MPVSVPAPPRPSSSSLVIAGPKKVFYLSLSSRSWTSIQVKRLASRQMVRFGREKTELNVGRFGSRFSVSGINNHYRPFDPHPHQNGIDLEVLRSFIEPFLRASRRKRKSKTNIRFHFLRKRKLGSQRPAEHALPYFLFLKREVLLLCRRWP